MWKKYVIWGFVLLICNLQGNFIQMTTDLNYDASTKNSTLLLGGDAADQIIIPTIEEIVSNGCYPMNQSSMTYGPDIPNVYKMDEPDLLLAKGVDGTMGYILRSDLESNVNTIEEALEYNKQRGRNISLYMHDGITIIGEFYLGK